DPAIAEVDVAVAPACDPDISAEVLTQHAGRADPADQVGGEIAVQDTQTILGGHRECRARRDGLLPVAVVERAGNLALAVQGHRAFLEAAHQEHRSKQPNPVLQLEMSAGSGGPARSRLSDIGRHYASLSLRPGRVGI